MRKNRSKYASKKYPELHKYSDSPYWIFRKYSVEKQAEFVKSTKIPGIEKEAARAYKKGKELFDIWLGSTIPSGRDTLIRDIARPVLASKESGSKNNYRTVRNQHENHILPAFGHLRPDQVTRLRWETYQSDERKKGKRTKLYNTRKALREILLHAQEQGLIRMVPKMPLTDGEAAAPVYIPKAEILKILRRASRTTKLLAFIVWKQGARPGEVLQYRYSMIQRAHGQPDRLAIPAPISKTRRSRTIPLNPKVARILRWLEPRVSSDLLFPSPADPNRPQKEYDTGWNRACAGPRRPGSRSDLRGAHRAQPEFSYTVYNLRDTYITDRLREGLSSTFIGKYCDTSATMIDKKYAVPTQDVMERAAGIKQGVVR